MAGLQLTGRRVLVTGGGVGIGLGITQAFMDEGAQVCCTYLTHRPEGLPADRLRQVPATDETEVAAAVEWATGELGGLDVLVNNVGGLVARTPITEMSLDLWQQVMDVNMTSTFLFSRAAARVLTDGGAIINVSSVAGHNGGGNGATAYATSKAAMFAFTRGLAKELAGRRITVNAVAPGLILDTPFHEIFTPPADQQAMVNTIPLGRAGYPADVAGSVLWLASPLASFVTGTVVDINGGAYFA